MDGAFVPHGGLRHASRNEAVESFVGPIDVRIRMLEHPRCEVTRFLRQFNLRKLQQTQEALRPEVG